MEPALDIFIHNEFLKEIPVLGLTIKLAQASRSVTDKIFLMKIAKFLEDLDAIPAAEAQAFAAEMEADPAVAERTGQALLLSLDSMNDLQKAPLLALVFSAYVRGKIGLESFRRLTAAIGLAMVEDIWELVKEDDPEDVKESRERRTLALHALRITGLTALSDTAFSLVGKSSYITTALTPLGELIIDILKEARQTPAAR